MQTSTTNVTSYSRSLTYSTVSKSLTGTWSNYSSSTYSGSTTANLSGDWTPSTTTSNGIGIYKTDYLSPTFSLESGTTGNTGTGITTGSWSESESNMIGSGSVVISGIVKNASVTSYSGGITPTSDWSVDLSYDFDSWTTTLTFNASKSGVVSNPKTTTINYTYVLYESVCLKGMASYTLTSSDIGYDDFTVTRTNWGSYTTHSSYFDVSFSYSENTATAIWTSKAPLSSTLSTSLSYNVQFRFNYKYTATKISSWIASTTYTLSLSDYSSYNIMAVSYSSGTQPSTLTYSGNVVTIKWTSLTEPTSTSVSANISISYTYTATSRWRAQASTELAYTPYNTPMIYSTTSGIVPNSISYLGKNVVATWFTGSNPSTSTVSWSGQLRYYYYN